MEDLIYWLGQIALVELELVGMALIIVLPILWIIGAIVELSLKFRINKPLFILNHKDMRKATKKT